MTAGERIRAQIGQLIWILVTGEDFAALNAEDGDEAPDADSYTPGQYRQARGIAPAAPDAEPAEATIRRQRGEGE